MEVIIINRIDTRTDKVDTGEAIILCYPRGPGAIEISTRDVKELEPGRQLGDNLINFGLKHLLAGSSPEVRYSTWAFDVFFAKRLQMLAAQEPTERFDLMRGWIRRVPLQHKKLLLIPVCERNHWYLVVCSNPRGFGYGPGTLVVLDSYRSAVRNQITDLIGGFLAMACGRENPEGECSIPRVHYPLVAQQPNDFDCGIFLLEYAAKILNNTQQLEADPQWVPEIVPTEVARTNRTTLLKTIAKLAAEDQPLETRLKQQQMR